MLSDAARIAGTEKRAFVPKPADDGDVIKLTDKDVRVDPATGDEQLAVDAFTSDSKTLAESIRSHASNPNASPERKAELEKLAQRLDGLSAQTHIPTEADRKTFADVKKLAGKERARFIPPPQKTDPAPPSTPGEHAAYQAHQAKISSNLKKLESHLSREDLDPQVKAAIDNAAGRLRMLKDSPNVPSTEDQREMRDLMVGLGEHGKEYKDPAKPDAKSKDSSGTSMQNIRSLFAQQASAGRADAKPEAASQAATANLQYGIGAAQSLGHGLLQEPAKKPSQQKPANADTKPNGVPPPNSDSQVLKSVRLFLTVNQ